MISETTYSDRVGQMLLDMEVGQIFVLIEKVAPENRLKFMNAVKSYIDKSFGWDENWEIIFNQDFTRIRKEERAKLKPSQIQ